MKSCIVYEPWAHGEGHVEFNKAFLDVLGELYEKIIFIGEKNHVSFLRSSVTNVSFIETNITDYGSVRGRLLSLFLEIKNAKKINKVKQKDDDIFITFGAVPTMLVFEKFFSNTNVVYIQHGLDILYKKLTPFQFNFWLPFAFKKCPPKHKIIVLGDSIRKNLVNLMPFISNKVFSMDHPIKKINNIKHHDIGSNSTIKIGTIGIGAIEKGILLLNDIGKFIKEENLDICVSHIGKNLNCYLDKTVVDVPFSSSTLIPREIFLDAVNGLDFILFLYPNDSYKLSASGAMFDAFQLGRPIIAMKNDYFDYVFSKNRNIGFLCRDFEDIKNILRNLKKLQQSEYEVMCEASQQILQHFSTDMVAMQLKKILSE